MIENLETQTIDGGINLGDNCDGRDRHGSGEYNDTNNILEQVETAESLLNEIPTDKWFFVQGSPYHTDQNVSSDALLSMKMGGRFEEEMVIKANGKRIHCSHAIGVSMASPAYRTTPIAREMMLATINEKEYGKFDLILRGHAHYFCRVQFGGTSGVICPCWKGRDAFASRRTLAMMPHIGYVLINIDSNGIMVEPHIYSLKGKELITEVQA
jgi:predicted phosphodiesterase